MAKVLLFGELREIAGTGTVNLTVSDIESLKKELFNRWPSFAHKTLLFAIDKKITHHNQAITEDNEIAVMPPFSGG